MHRELLNAHLFYSLSEVRWRSEGWHLDYNTERSRKSLVYLPPTLYAQVWHERSAYARKFYPQMRTEMLYKLKRAVWWKKYLKTRKMINLETPKRTWRPIRGSQHSNQNQTI